jgi:hypothetical protein
VSLLSLMNLYSTSRWKFPCHILDDDQPRFPKIVETLYLSGFDDRVSSPFLIPISEPI